MKRSTKILLSAFAPVVTPTANIPSPYIFSDNRSMPVIGLGVYLSEPGDETEHAVRFALAAGYRLADTAAAYDNEESVGKAVKESGILREELWITTKLMGDDHGFRETIDAAKESLDQLDLEYLDMYLIHSPFGGNLIETWDAMLLLQKYGQVKSIGVSNFGIPHLEAIREHGRPMPVINQFELHPLNYKERLPLIKYCQDHNILVQAYGSILAGQSDWLRKELLANICKKYDRTPAQVLLRWAVQHGFLIIPKSVNKKRIESNFQIFDFEIGDEDMTALDNWSGELDEYWNPIEEADVHLGDTHHWPDYEESTLEKGRNDDSREDEIEGNDSGEGDFQEDEEKDDDSAESEEGSFDEYENVNGESGEGYFQQYDREEDESGEVDIQDYDGENVEGDFEHYGGEDGESEEVDFQKDDGDAESGEGDFLHYGGGDDERGGGDFQEDKEKDDDSNESEEGNFHEYENVDGESGEGEFQQYDREEDESGEVDFQGYEGENVEGDFRHYGGEYAESEEGDIQKYDGEDDEGGEGDFQKYDRADDERGEHDLQQYDREDDESGEGSFEKYKDEVAYQEYLKVEKENIEDRYQEHDEKGDKDAKDEQSEL